MLTSYYGNLKNIVAPLEPVCISVGRPRFLPKMRSEPRLAPTREMLKMSLPAYNRLYFAQLAALDPREIAEALGDNAVMLCWEKPGFCCHRRAAAEWLEKALDIQIRELGFVRGQVLAYSEMPLAPKK